ncbi:MAG: nicotinate (nicotinamide) nucleotide adenylyltransferase [Bacteroidales bacterium]
MSGINTTNKKVALFFGSFNPIHIGHLSIADYIIDKKITNELWFILTPQNPFKEQKTLWDDKLRLSILKQSTEDKSVFIINTIEFDLPKPNYTFNTLQRLSDKYKHVSFSLIIGSDNWKSFDTWRNFQTIIDNYNILIYPRSGYDINNKGLPKTVQLLEAPIIDISSTQIRKMLNKGDEKALAYLHTNVRDLVRELFLNSSPR